LAALWELDIQTIADIRTILRYKSETGGLSNRKGGDETVG
jgi:hypothetical protein